MVKILENPEKSQLRKALRQKRDRANDKCPSLSFHRSPPRQFVMRGHNRMALT